MHVPRQQPEPDGQAKACRCVLGTVSAPNAQNPGCRPIFKTLAVFSPRARGLCRYRRTQPGVVGAEDIRTGWACRLEVANTKVMDVAWDQFHLHCYSASLRWWVSTRARGVLASKAAAELRIALANINCGHGQLVVAPATSEPAKWLPIRQPAPSLYRPKFIQMGVLLRTTAHASTQAE